LIADHTASNTPILHLEFKFVDFRNTASFGVAGDVSAAMPHLAASSIGSFVLQKRGKCIHLRVDRPVALVDHLHLQLSKCLSSKAGYFQTGSSTLSAEEPWQEGTDIGTCSDGRALRYRSTRISAAASSDLNV